MAVVRKLIRFGGSLTLTVPQEIRKHLGINRGDYVVWAIDKDSRVIVDKLTPKKHPGFFIPGTGWVKREK